MRTYKFTEEESSNVRQIGYDTGTEEMSVVFKDGKTRYVYSNVPAATAGNVIFAPSIGVAVRALLVDAGFKFRKELVGEPAAPVPAD